MAHKNRREDERHDEDQSLIPAIRDREVRLAALLEETREQGRAQVLEAEAAAARRVAAAREEAARSADERRRREAERAEAEVVEMEKGLEQRVAAIGTTSERNLERAVSEILRVVRGEGNG